MAKAHISAKQMKEWVEFKQIFIDRAVGNIK